MTEAEVEMEANSIVHQKWHKAVESTQTRLGVGSALFYSLRNSRRSMGFGG